MHGLGLIVALDLLCEVLVGESDTGPVHGTLPAVLHGGGLGSASCESTGEDVQLYFVKLGGIPDMMGYGIVYLGRYGV